MYYHSMQGTVLVKELFSMVVEAPDTLVSLGVDTVVVKTVVPKRSHRQYHDSSIRKSLPVVISVHALMSSTTPFGDCPLVVWTMVISTRDTGYSKVSVCSTE